MELFVSFGPIDAWNFKDLTNRSECWPQPLQENKDSLSEITMAHLWQDYILWSRVIYFLIRLNKFTLIFKILCGTFNGYLTLHHTCMPDSCSQIGCMIELDLTTRCLACLSPSLSTLTPLFSRDVPHTHKLLQPVTRRQDYECFQVVCRVTGQPRISHFLTWGRTDGGRHQGSAGAATAESMWRSRQVVFTHSSVSRPAALFCRPLLLPPAARVSRRVHGLAHASLDCNTRHFECSASSLETPTTQTRWQLQQRQHAQVRRRNNRYRAREIRSHYLSELTGTLPLPIYCK